MNKKIPVIILGGLAVILAGAFYYQKYWRQPANQAPAGNSPALNVEEAKAIASAATSDCYNQGSLTGRDDFYNENTKTWWLGWAPALPKEDCNPACVVSEENKAVEINWRCTGLAEASSTEPEIEVNRVTTEYGYIRTFEVQDGREVVNIDPIEWRTRDNGGCTDNESEASAIKPLCNPNGFLVVNQVYELLPLPLAVELYIERTSDFAASETGKRQITPDELKAIDPELKKTMPFKIEMEKGEVVRIYEIYIP